MNKDITPQNLPQQQEGSSVDTYSEVDCNTTEEAQALYNESRTRLLSVNSWHEYAGKATATFRLFSMDGKPKTGFAEKGDYFQIDIPGPGPREGDGFDWVQVEDIEETDDDLKRMISMRVRPAANPEDSQNDATAHFFTHEATSNFVVTLAGKEVKAAVFGRNEKPNLAETSALLDKARNAAVGTSAAAGISKIQWKSLVNGLLKI